MIKFPNQGPTLCQKYSESRPKNRAYHCYRAVATVPVRLLFTYTVNIWPRNQTYTVTSGHGLGFCTEIQIIIIGQ